MLGSNQCSCVVAVACLALQGECECSNTITGCMLGEGGGLGVGRGAVVIGSHERAGFRLQGWGMRLS